MGIGHIEALYDSLKRDQVELAIKTVVPQCSPEWGGTFVDWLLTSINMSLDSAVGQFKGGWSRSSWGVATAGKLCVYVANTV